MLKSYLIVFFISMLPSSSCAVPSRWASGWACPFCRPIWSVWWAICCRCRSSICSPVKFSSGATTSPSSAPFAVSASSRAKKEVVRWKPRPGAASWRRCCSSWGIPLPGTGAWTGTLAASILDMKFKDVLIACMGGVLLAGIIMGLASAGLLGALSGLFAV
mgnify:CR=1 FL=1